MAMATNTATTPIHYLSRPAKVLTRRQHVTVSNSNQRVLRIGQYGEIVLINDLDVPVIFLASSCLHHHVFAHSQDNHYPPDFHCVR
jgi:hypothetical protein